MGSATRLTGTKGPDIIGKRVTEIFMPIISEAEIVRIKIYGDIAINGGSYEIEEFSETLQRWYKIKVYSPKKYYFISHFIDVSKEIGQLTEIKNRLSIVEESEFQFKALADYAYGWLTWEDAAGKLKYVSPACKIISGYSGAQFLENESLFASIIIEEDKEIWFNHRHEIRAESGKHSVQFRMRKTDGKIVWIEHTCRPVVDNEGVNLGYRANNNDITECKREEAALRESEVLYRSIINASPNTIVTTDLEGCILFVLPRTLRMFGCARKELLGHLLTDFIVPEDRHRASNNPDLELQYVMTEQAEYQGLRADGSAF